MTNVLYGKSILNSHLVCMLWVVSLQCVDLGPYAAQGKKLRERRLKSTITITPSAKTCISFLSRDGDPLEGVETKHGFYIMHFCLDSFGGNFRDTTLASVWYFWFKVLKLLENWKNYDLHF